MPNGQLDASFGPNSTGLVQLNPMPRTPLVVVEPSDNSILVDWPYAFNQSGTVQPDYLAHYSSTGNLDLYFGSPGESVQGTGIVSFAPGLSRSSLALQSVSATDLKIVVAIGVLPSQVGTTPTELVRYNLDGTLDTTFGTQGVATLPLGYQIGTGPGVWSSYGAVLVEPQIGGDIIAFGSTAQGGTAPIAFTANGTLDTSFGSGGIGAATPFQETGSLMESVAIVPGYGRIIAVGESSGSFAVGAYLGSSTITTAAMLPASASTSGSTSLAAPLPSSAATQAVDQAVTDIGTLDGSGDWIDPRAFRLRHR